MVPGQSGCGLTANQPSGVVTIPIAEINNKKFQPILNALMNGTLVNATLTSEGMFLYTGSQNLTRARNSCNI